MKLQVLVVVVTACGGGSKAPTTNTGVGIGTKALYAPVFVKGTSWTFSAETKTTPPVDMGQPTTETKPDIVCTVTDVHEMPSKSGPVSMATVGCVAGTDTSPTGNMPPAGIYASSSSGLWYFEPKDPKAHDKAMALDPRELVIPAGDADRAQARGQERRRQRVVALREQAGRRRRVRLLLERRRRRGRLGLLLRREGHGQGQPLPGRRDHDRDVLQAEVTRFARL
jgi:hypothetical protein